MFLTLHSHITCQDGGHPPPRDLSNGGQPPPSAEITEGEGVEVKGRYPSAEVTEGGQSQRSLPSPPLKSREGGEVRAKTCPKNPPAKNIIVCLSQFRNKLYFCLKNIRSPKLRYGLKINNNFFQRFYNLNMKLKTASDWVDPKGFIVAFDERYKIPSEINLLSFSQKQLLKKLIFLKK